MKKIWGLMTGMLLVWFALGMQTGYAQRDPDAGKSVAQVEKELANMAADILRHDSTDLKFEMNKQFIVRLTNLLKRPDSYNHDFDSLKTVSRLHPADGAFRIFTWYIVDKPANTFYAELAHYYFGLVQRRYVDAKGKTHYIVIPLMEMERIPKGIESAVTDNLSWFGALYYQPKGAQNLLAYEGHYYKLVPKKGEVTSEKDKTELVYTFVPGKAGARKLKEVDKLKYSNHKRVKEAITYYVLMGWNGWDNKSNYKVIDVMTFDPEDSSRVNFGAPIFYFDRIPKSRGLFKYSDYSSFTMNTGYVKRGPLGLFKKRMIVYDHLAPPNKARATELWELGPDGSYDAIAYYPKYGGYFEWYRKVDVADKYEGKKHAKEMAKLQKYWASQDSLTFPNYNELSSRKAQRKIAKANKKELKRQQKEAERRLRESGIDINARRRERQ